MRIVSTVFFRADISTGAPATFNKSLLLKILQRPSDRGAGDAKAFHELGLAGEPAGLAIFSRDDFSGQLAGDGAVF